jgi:6-phosphogluconolactonase
VTDWLVGAYGPDMDGHARGVVKLTSREDGGLRPVEGYLIEAPSPAFLAHGHGGVYAALEGERAVVKLGTDERFGSGGQWPCHVGVYGESVVVANYFDGSIGLATGQVLEAEPGRGPRDAQAGPHAHATAQVGGLILSADLGTDRLVLHTLLGGVLERIGWIPLTPGTGPRDILVDGSLVYVLGEHGLTITILEASEGGLTPLFDVPLPGAQQGDQAAALALANGFLYAGLRGSNQISVLRLTNQGRGLSPVGSVSTAGDWPRHLVTDGAVLHVANQLSSTVASFSLGADGIPSLIGEPCPTPSPTHLLLDFEKSESLVK